MQLDNASPFVANVQVANPGTEDLFAAAIIKSTFEIHPDGRLSVSEDPQPLVLDQLDTPYGMFHGELFLKKRGIDVAVLGTVQRAHPVGHAEVRLRIGDRRLALRATGDRAWIPSVRTGGLEPSRPVPFKEMPLGYHRVYGGTSEYNGMQAPFADNPIGRGYYLEEAQAEGKLLPNIEPAAGPFVQKWTDMGRVVGFGPYPMFWALRGVKNVKVHPSEPVIEQVGAGIFNHAHPDLVFEQLEEGTPITVEGLHETPIRVRVPRAPARVEVCIGPRSESLPAPIDGVFLWADARKLVVTQRARFSYVYRPEELRKVTVHRSQS